MAGTKWNNEAKALLGALLKRDQVSHEELAQKLKEIGIIETRASIASKLSRGTFSTAFLLQCLHVLGRSEMSLK